MNGIEIERREEKERKWGLRGWGWPNQITWKSEPQTQNKLERNSLEYLLHHFYGVIANKELVFFPYWYSCLCNFIILPPLLHFSFLSYFCPQNLIGWFINSFLGTKMQIGDCGHFLRRCLGRTADSLYAQVVIFFIWLSSYIF